MTNKILKEVDAAIAQLEHARTLLLRGQVISTRGTKMAVKNANAGKESQRKRHSMSEEGRERVRQAQLRRWAAVRRDAKKTTS